MCTCKFACLITFSGFNLQWKVVRVCVDMHMSMYVMCVCLCVHVCNDFWNPKVQELQALDVFSIQLILDILGYLFSNFVIVWILIQRCMAFVYLLFVQGSGCIMMVFRGFSLLSVCVCEHVLNTSRFCYLGRWKAHLYASWGFFNVSPKRGWNSASGLLVECTDKG